jgi:hypothetical protein
MWLIENDWENLSYLSSGTPEQQSIHHAINAEGLLTQLAAYSPTLVSTHCIGLNTPSSDLDIICSFPDSDSEKAEFLKRLKSLLNGKHNFSGIHQREGSSAVVARYSSLGWDFEIYADVVPVQLQNAYRHLTIMHSLLQLGGSVLKADVLKLRAHGQKGEAAFCSCLAISGDPYQKLLEFELMSLSEVQGMLVRAGYTSKNLN